MPIIANYKPLFQSLLSIVIFGLGCVHRASLKVWVISWLVTSQDLFVNYMKSSKFSFTFKDYPILQIWILI